MKILLPIIILFSYFTSPGSTIEVESHEDPRYQAYVDSLHVHNIETKVVSEIFDSLSTINTIKDAYYVKNHVIPNIIEKYIKEYYDFKHFRNDYLKKYKKNGSPEKGLYYHKYFYVIHKKKRVIGGSYEVYITPKPITVVVNSGSHSKL